MKPFDEAELCVYGGGVSFVLLHTKFILISESDIPAHLLTGSPKS